MQAIVLGVGDYDIYLSPCAGAYFTRIPGVAPESADNRNTSSPPGPAAKTMPSDIPKRIFLGFRLATAMTNRPVSSSGL
jgi:hypothetical protein